jgi:hypothetical protein
MYMAGSQMLATYPLVPLWQSHGVGVAMFSLNGNIDIGLNMDRTVIADPAVFGQCMQWSFKEMRDADKADLPIPADESVDPEPKKPKKAPPMGTR